MPTKKSIPSKTTYNRWSATTKTVVGLSLVALLAAILVRFNYLIGPLLLAFIISYILHPWVERLARATGLNWRAAVSLIFVAFLGLVVWLSILGGSAAVDQISALISSGQDLVTNLPEFASQLGSQTIHLGPFTIQLAEVERVLEQEFNLSFVTLGQQLLSTLQPVLGQAGSLIGRLATGALSTLGWAAFVFVISYFLLVDAEGVPSFFAQIANTGHDADIRRIGRELSRIWDTFLRGQLLIITLVVVTYLILMTILGVHNALGLAFLTGLAKFVPYVGPLVAGATAALVAYFQPGGNYLGIEPFTYSVVVVVGTLVLDQIFDNLVSPRIFGKRLGVHPAAVLVAALVAASLLGFVGLLLAAPVLASAQLLFTFALRKMLDLNPWPKREAKAEPASSSSVTQRLNGAWRAVRARLERAYKAWRKRRTAR
ncbi:MAG: AI-2E family transporter [Anaerolineales bacterium]|jgi:predicted PurR-regulated permease PerM|nr:AI-2E family transporter [Anaerolineales bacterium]MCW5838904.1 AI-2E family transporter [Anaerolineales bacterium]MCW5887207.1 AI-2E family transporter [Anaerolineales bacterium]